jgi:hypothetical protein
VNRYSFFVGLAFLALVVVATVNTFGDEEGGVLGGEETEPGMPLPEFALPDLRGQADADANIFQDDCETAANPCPEEDRRVPACEIEIPGAIRVCDLFDRPLVLSFWFTTPSECPPTQDAVDAVARRYEGEANFLSVAVRGERDELIEIATERGWTVPIGWDRDGAVSNLYRVGGCPTVALALPGGILHEALIGDAAGQSELADAVEGLLRASRRRAEAVR